MDVMDLSGEHQVDVHHNVYKTRMDINGKVLSDKEQSSIGTITSLINNRRTSGQG
jgi:hypothetical protein